MKYPAIPYMGSKRAIAVDLITTIRARHPNAKYFYDVFGGGGAMSIAALMSGQFTKVFYGEKNERVKNLLFFLKDLNGAGLPKDWWDWVSREKFFEIINSDRTDAYSGMVQYCWSFGNSGKAYLFGKGIERQKELIHNMIVFGCKKSSWDLKQEFDIDIKPSPYSDFDYQRDYIGFYKPQTRNLIRKYQDLERLQQLEQLEQQEQQEQLEQLDCGDYRLLQITTPPEETVVYCDPPYRGTASYVSGEFDYKEFDRWFKNLPCVAYLSEYDSPHTLIGSIKKASLFNNSKKTKTIKLENLYFNRG